MTTPQAPPPTYKGMAELLVDGYHEKLRYCSNTKTWFVWNGLYWSQDARPLMLEWLTKLIREEQEFARGRKAEGDKKRLLSFESPAAYDRIIDLASCDRRIRIESDQLDRNAVAFNCLNGILLLNTWELLPHDPAALITRVALVEWDPDAQCPLWKSFLDHVFERDQEMISFVQCCIGCTLTGSTRDQVLFIAHGEGENGKTTLLHTLLMMLGSYGHAVNASLVAAGSGDAKPADYWTLFKSRALVVSELPKGMVLNEPKLKAVTGSDLLSLRTPSGGTHEVRLALKLWMATNHLPKISEDVHALWRRILLIPFNVTISEADRDNLLKERLAGELSGILRWAAEGTRAWIEGGGIKVPAKVRRLVEQYRLEQNPVARFIYDCCVEGPDQSALSSVLIERYSDWAPRNNERIIASNVLGRALGRLGYTSGKNGDGNHLWRGIALKAKASKASDASSNDSGGKGVVEEGKVPPT